MKKLNTIFICLLIMSLVVSTFFTSGCTKKKEIKIGAILPLTGDIAQYGEDGKRGIELGVEEINKRGGIKGRRIVVIYEDSKGDPKEGVSAARKLINIHKVPVIIGSVASSVTLAFAPIAQQNSVIVISPGSSSPKLSEVGNFIFRTCPSDILEGKVIAERVYKNIGFRKVAILYINNDYGVGLRDVFLKHFTKLGGAILAAESFETNTTDFRTQLVKLWEKRPEAIFMIGYYKEMSKILRQAREIGLKIQFLSTDSFGTPKLIELAGNAAEGVIFSSIVKPTEGFVNKFTNRFGVGPDIIGPYAYDAMMIAAYCIEKSGYSSDAIQKELMKIKEFPGVTGKTTFDENGDPLKEVYLMIVKNGKFISYFEQKQ